MISAKLIRKIYPKAKVVNKDITQILHRLDVAVVDTFTELE